MDPDTLAHTEKIIADLLALTLAENEPDATAAFGAIRRRAERDAVTGGVVKLLLQRLLASSGALIATSLQDEVGELRWVVGDQRRELDQTRHAMHRGEIALAEARQTNTALSDRIGLLTRARRRDRVVGFLAGFGCAAAGAAAFLLGGLFHSGAGGPAAAGTLPPGPQAAVVDTLHSCFLSSVNSLVGGNGFDMHLLIDTDATGRIARVQVAPGQIAALADPQLRQYAGLLLRTLGPGCGVLPLPASWLGRPGRLDLMLPP